MKQILLLITGFSLSLISYSQDILYFIDGSQREVKVLEITIDSLLYRDCSDSVQNKIALSDVFMAIYENGSKEVFKKEINNSNIDNQSSSNKVKREKTNTTFGIKYNDRRKNKLIIGEVFSRGVLITGTTKKVKDKKNSYFPAFKKLFEERLESKNFELAQIGDVEVNINELFYKFVDKFSYMETLQTCTLNVVVRHNDKIVLNRNYSSVNSSKANFLRDYAKQNGYKASALNVFEGASVFIVVIDDIIDQIQRDINNIN